MFKLKVKIKIVVLFILVSNYSSLNSEVFYTSFENGFDGWEIIGDSNYVVFDSLFSSNRKKSVKILRNGSGISRKVEVEPLAITDFSTVLKCSSDFQNKLKLKIEFYDSLNQKLIEYIKESNEIKWSTKLNSTIAPPFVKYAIYSILWECKDGGYVNIDECLVSTNNLQVFRKPQCNLDEYSRPFWCTDTIFDEAILMYSFLGERARGKLLYTPNKILSVNNYLGNKYLQDRDYILQGKEIIRNKESLMPFRNDTSYIDNINWYNNYTNGAIFEPQWIFVTYTHDRDWNINKKINYKEKLPKTLKKLSANERLNIVALGMSITKGMNVTSQMNFQPFMPTYVELFETYLKKYYLNTKVTSFNASMPGSTIYEYGIHSIEKYIKPLKPDLLILEFGMNDFWALSPQEYKKYILQIIDSVNQINPNVEYLLVSSIMFDPSFIPDTLNPRVKELYFNLRGFQKVLKELEKVGIVNIDMNTLSDSLYIAKKAKDLLSNPTHPNDYMARWYAQGLISALVPVMSGSINKVVNRSNQLVLDNLESKVAQSKVGTNEIIISNKQDWEFHKLENGNNRILSNDSKLALAFEIGELIQAIIKDTSSQEWELIPLDDQFYKLKNIATQKYLSIDTISNKLILENESNSNAQQWNIFYSYKKEELTINRDTTITDYTVDSSQSIQIESNTQWTAATTSNWIHFDKNQGNGNKLLKLSIDENIEKSQRSAFIEISTSGLKKQHYVVQSGSKTNINDSVEEKFNVKIIPPTENDNNIYLICEECLTSNITVEIFDLTGRLISQRDYSQTNQIIKIESNQFSSSQYLLKVSNGSQSKLLKFVVAK